MTITDRYILFFGPDWPSNFAPSPITIDDEFWYPSLFEENSGCPKVIFKTAEAYFQSRKALVMDDKDSYYKILNASTPAETKRIARTIKLDRERWDNIRVAMMMDTLKQKFTQNPELLKKLLDPSLKYKHFVEASPYDAFWGAGLDERALVSVVDNPTARLGDNMLGVCLDHTREILSI